METRQQADARHQRAERAVFGVTRPAAMRELLRKFDVETAQRANALQRTPARGLVARLIRRIA